MAGSHFRDFARLGRGWLQDVNFVMFGLMMGVFTIALYRGVKPGPSSLTGLGASMLSALGLILMGVFPMTRDRSASLSRPTTMRWRPSSRMWARRSG